MKLNKVGIRLFPSDKSPRTIAENLKFSKDHVEAHHDTGGTGRPFSRERIKRDFPGAGLGKKQS